MSKKDELKNDYDQYLTDHPEVLTWLLFNFQDLNFFNFNISGKINDGGFFAIGSN